MKLVDILARELKAWPEGLECLSQLKGTGYIINGKGFDGRAFDALQIADETLVAGAIVTRAEWQAAVDALNAPKVVEWDEVGLPPVGLDVEIKRGNCTWIDGDEWQIGKTATVMASFLNSRDIEMASVQFPGGHCECILARCLSPIRTAEQVAAEVRDKAIKEMMQHGVDAGDSTIEYSCAALYDAGYRQEPKPCGS